MARSPWHRFQMPAYHLARADGHGVTLVNIGVGPSNAKTICDHLAVLRPHCWLMVGHCGGLRATQTIGDYVLAHAYPAPGPHPRRAGAARDPDTRRWPRLQIALQAGGGAGDGRGRRDAQAPAAHRHPSSPTTNRNWELRWTQERRRFNLSARHRHRHGERHDRGPGLPPCACPYGTLLCVSDKPLHGEIKLPGAASAFYQRAVGEHLMNGLAALEILCAARRPRCTQRKLRGFGRGRRSG